MTLLTVDGRRAATFITAEEVRPDARAELAALAAQGYDLWLISGDAQPRVSRFAASLGIPLPHALGEMRPEDKARAVSRIDRRDSLFLGDGLNDALALPSAFVAGTTAIDRPVLPERADFFLLGEGVAALRVALELSRRLRVVLRRNLALAALYNALAVAACLAGVMTPLRAAVAMPASSLALLLLTVRSLSERRRAVPVPVPARATPLPLEEAA